MRESVSRWKVLLTLFFASSQVVKAVPPTITRSPLNQNEFTGDTAVFTCVATGADSYEWEKNGKIPTINRWQANGQSLEFKDLLMKDSEMKITCRARNAAGSDEAHAWLTVLERTNQPPKPSVLNVEVLSSDSVEVSWTELESGPDSADTFTVEYRKMWNIDSDWEQKPDILNSRTTLDDLLPNREYSVRVFGVNRAGRGPSTGWETVKTLEDAPSGSPRKVDVEVLSPWQLQVKWDLPDEDKRNGDITMYQIRYEKLKKAEKSRVTLFKNTTGSERQTLLERINGIEPYSTYYISVSAFTAVGQGPFSDSKAVVETPQTAPNEPPKDVKAVPEGTGIRVTWKAPSGALNGELVGYNITYKSADLGFKEVANVTMTFIADLLPYTNYTVRVYALTDRANKFAGPSSTPEKVRTNEQPPSAAPGKFVVDSATHDSVTVSWLPPLKSAHNGVLTSYVLQYCRGEDKCSSEDIQEINVSIDKQSRTVHNLNPYTTYTFLLMAKNKAGIGPATMRHPRTAEAAPSGPPRKVSVNIISAWEVEVTWEEPAKEKRNGEITHYDVKYEKMTKSTNYMRTTDTRLQLGKTDGIRPHTNYTVSVSAFTSAGQGPYSSPVTFTTNQDVPGPPELRLHVRHHKWLEASWGPPQQPNGKITAYSLWHKEIDESEFIKNDKIPHSQRQYRIEKLIGNKTYSVQLRARTSAGWGAWASMTGTTLSGPPDIAPPRVRIGAKTNTSLEIMWDEMDPRKQHGIIRHYHITIRLATGSSLQHAKTVPGSHRSFVEEGLKPFTMYSISVAATTNGTGPYSDPIEARTKQASPSKVLNVTLERITSKSVELAWREPSEPRGVIKHYEVGYRSSSMSDYVLYQTRDSNTSFTIEQLIPYTSYDIIVLAVNSHRGFPSDVITGQTKEDLPGPPHSVSFSHSNKQRTAHVSWEEPEIKNGIIKEYTLTYRALKPTVKGYKYKDERVVEAGNREYEFNDMQPNMQYNFTVWAHTSVGHGIKKSTIGQIMASEPEKTPTPRLINDTLLPRDQKKLALSRADETFGTIQYYRLGVFYAPLSRPSSRQQREDDSWKNYIAAHFGPDRVPAIYTVGDNSTYLNNLFRNRPLEMGYKYHFVFYAHVDEGIIGESEPTETFELVLPTAKPEDESGSGGFPVAIIIVVVLVVLAVIIALIIFIFLWMKLHQRETVKDKVPPIDEVDLGEADTDDSIEYLRRQARSTMEKYPPVRISDFEMHVKRLQANANLKFSQEYESIRLDMDFTSVASNLAVNDEKNRYSNIVAYDHTRVRLSAVKGQQGSDYINANYIDGHKKKNAYIATQGPLKETAGDFWQMVWEQRSSTIVMLTNLEERGRPKCYRYWPDMGSAVFDTMEITQKDVITLADYVVRTFAVAKTEHPDEVREVKQLQFMSWPDHGVPTYATAMLAFQRKVRAANPPNSGPVIVHCSAGVGRTGAFIVIDAMLDRIQELDTIDVYGHVSVLRSQRNYMVQTEDQYFFIHEAVLEAIQCGDTEINAKDLPTAMQRLNEVVSDDGSIAIELEFKRLAMDKLDPNRFSTANRSVNKNKNRFVNILPFENTRVVLSYTRGVDGSDYINASLVDGYKQRNAFIATQGPLKETEQEFWRMLWEQESKVIVMLTKLTERGQEKCHQYWPEGKAARYGSFLVVEPLSEQRKADCILRQFKMTNAHDGSSRTLCQYQYVGWPENRSPVSGRALIDLIGEVQKLQDKTHDAGPVTVHCSAGVGRTGCFIALSVVLERMRCEGVLDIFQTVKMLRIQRPAMVQTLDQYQFVYDTALEYLDSFDHYADYAPLDVQEDEQEVD